MIPGRLLHRIATLTCSAKSLEHVVEPAIADLQRERGMALLASYIAVLKVIGMSSLDMSEAPDGDRRAVKQTLAWAFVLTCAVTMLFVLPPLFTFPEVPGRSRFVATLLPQALPLAIPIGLAFAVAVALSGRSTMNVVKAIVLVAVAASSLSFATLVWGLPAGHEVFRRVVADVARSNGEAVPANPLKGPNQMRLSELRREISGMAAAGDHRHARHYSWAFHLRFALAAAVLAVATFLLALPVNRRAIRGLVAGLTCFSYWALMHFGEFAIRHDYLSPFAGAWLPNVVCLAGTIVAVLYSTRRMVRLKPDTTY